MEVKSKFNITDTIYFICGEMPSKGTIIGITFFTGSRSDHSGQNWKTDKMECSVTYHLEEMMNPINEKKAYATKEELKKALFASL